MPVDYRKYHPAWKRISRFVRLIRAGNRCEQCGIENYALRIYLEDGKRRKTSGYRTYGEAMTAKRDMEHFNSDNRFSIIVLTVAHLDHDIANNNLDNLKCLCQACHLGHDRHDNAERRRYGKTGKHHNQIRLKL